MSAAFKFFAGVQKGGVFQSGLTEVAMKFYGVIADQYNEQWPLVCVVVHIVCAKG